MLIKDEFNHKSYMLKENSMVVVYLKNHFIIKGKLFVKNDSMINVDDTAIHISSINFLKTHAYDEAKVWIGGGLSALGVGFTGLSLVYFNASTNTVVNNCNNNISYCFLASASLLVGCASGLTGSSMLFSQLFNQKKFDLQSQYHAEIITIMDRNNMGHRPQNRLH